MVEPIFAFFTRLGLHSCYRTVLTELGWRSKTISLFQSNTLQILSSAGIFLLHLVPLLTTGGNAPIAQTVIREQQNYCLLSVHPHILQLYLLVISLFIFLGCLFIYLKKPEQLLCVCSINSPLKQLTFNNTNH